MPSYQYYSPTSQITLVNQLAVQPIFVQAGALANGAVTLKANTRYHFEMMLYITALSSTSSSFYLEFAGATTITNILWTSTGIKAGGGAAGAALSSTYQFGTTLPSTANVAMVPATTGTAGWVLVKGQVRALSGGTFIPKLGQNLASSACIIAVNSYFKITAMGDNTDKYQGNWS
jgi:hypothetical protein